MIYVRMYWPMILCGIAVGCLATVIILAAVLSGLGPTVDKMTFWIMTAWALSLFCTGAILGAVGATFWKTPYDRREIAARHAQRPVDALEA
jgi:H+/Cl- antiporter ClcA